MGDAKRRRERGFNSGEIPPGFVDIRPDKSTAPLSNLPPNVTPYDYQQFIQENWGTIAAFAYDRYLHEGKGLLILDWDLSIDKALGPLLPPSIRESNQVRSARIRCPIFYVSESGPLQSYYEQFITSTKWAQLVQRYNPDETLILCLCWGYDSNTGVNIMARTIALLNCPSPKETYLEQGGRMAESVYMAAKEEKAPGSEVQSKVVRQFNVSIQDPQFYGSLQQAFTQGIQKYGRGALLLIPQGEHAQCVFMPVNELTAAFDPQGERPTAVQDLLGIVRDCDPQTQIAVVLIDGDISTGDFMYYPYLAVSESEVPAGGRAKLEEMKKRWREPKKGA